MTIYLVAVAVDEDLPLSGRNSQNSGRGGGGDQTPKSSGSKR